MRVCDCIHPWLRLCGQSRRVEVGVTSENGDINTWASSCVYACSCLISEYLAYCVQFNRGNLPRPHDGLMGQIGWPWPDLSLSLSKKVSRDVFAKTLFLISYFFFFVSFFPYTSFIHFYFFSHSFIPQPQQHSHKQIPDLLQYIHLSLFFNGQAFPSVPPSHAHTHSLSTRQQHPFIVILPLPLLKNTRTSGTGHTICYIDTSTPTLPPTFTKLQPKRHSRPLCELGPTRTKKKEFLSHHKQSLAAAHVRFWHLAPSFIITNHIFATNMLFVCRGPTET